MSEPRKGRQTPTKSIILPYTETRGQEAIEIYNSSGRTAQEWQELLIYDIMAVNEDGLWVHTKFGEEIPRRNGKNEVVVIREMWGLLHSERILHTAHRTTTSTSASRRLVARLVAAGYEEVTRIKKGQMYDKHFTYTKQMGMERIVLLCEGGGTIDFRTRSSSGGLGEGFDLLVIDEAQEYTDNQETALKYVVTDSRNPQTIFCGTPPTTVSAGTVFVKLRSAALQGEIRNTGWAEWSVDEMTDPNDKDAWYETNPSLGTVLTERAVQDEIGTDKIDFNIQRLGLWLRYNQKSAISRREWENQQCKVLPKLSGKLFVGIKYGHDGDSVAMAIAVKTADGRIFVESIDCRPQRAGNGWMDNEANIIGENEAASAGEVTVAPVKMVPVKIEYGARFSDEYLYASEEKKLDTMKAFNVGFSAKAARALDIMAFHGVNPRTGVLSPHITQYFDKAVQTVDYDAAAPDNCVEDAVALLGDADITGIAMSRTFTSAMAKLENATGGKKYPDLAWGGQPKQVNGVPASVNSIVSFGSSKDRAIVGDFANYFKWGYAKQIPMEIIKYGDPDNTGKDLRGHHQIYMRAEVYLGWAIMSDDAFARIVAAG